MAEWIWQQPQWPSFKYDPKALVALEQQFLQNAGFLLGAFKHISAADQDQLKIDLVSEEAVETSAIEGEFLDRASVQSSLCRDFGIINDNKRVPPSEQGISYMMVDLYKNFAKPLSHELLFDWHLNLMNARGDLTFVGCYRQDSHPMQVVSGTPNKLKIHYEAPPSQQVMQEMERYVHWFNHATQMPALTKAGIAHLYFEMVHPFEDGNGRIGRAIAEKSISQSLKQPLLLAVSRAIQKNKKLYYSNLAASNNNLEITDWLVYFASLLISAQEYTRSYIEFLIAKTKLYDRVKDQLNPRQDKVIKRMFKEGVDGFKGGLSAENYITITDTSRATATRDLQDLLAKQVLFSTGELKSTRYFLAI
jgi:Fic family protein